MKVRAPVQRKSGGTDPAQNAENIFRRAPPLFGSKSTISRFGECFRDGQYSVVSFLFAVLLTVPPCSQPFVKCPWSRHHCNEIRKLK